MKGINATYEGLIPKVQKSFFSKAGFTYGPTSVRSSTGPQFKACPECDGTRHSEGARSSKIEGTSIADASAMQVTDLAEWVGNLNEPSAAPLLTALQAPLDSFVQIGLGYLSLDHAPRNTVRGRSAADQDDPPPRLLAHRHHLRIRRAPASGCTHTTSSG